MKKRVRQGMSLVELLVCISILAVLVSLTIVGITSIRESSRRLTCQNNLRQFGTAIHSFEAARKRLPTLRSTIQTLENGRAVFVAASLHYQLLAYVEQADLANQPVPTLMASSVDIQIAYAPLKPIDSTSIPIFQCPADAFGLGTSYRTCIGPDSHLFENKSIDEGGLGLFGVENPTVARASRGSSHVCMISERLRSSVGSFEPSADVWFGNLVPPYAPVKTEILKQAAYNGFTLRPTRYYDFSGRSWFHSGALFTTYTHAVPPNAAATSLLASSHLSDTGWGALVSASSRHSGGVNCLLGDGSVQFFSNNVDQLIWQDFATAVLK